MLTPTSVVNPKAFSLLEFPRVFSGIRWLDIIAFKFPTKPVLSDFNQLIYANSIPLRVIKILFSHLFREILGGLLFAVIKPKFAHAVLVSPSVLFVQSNDSFVIL